MELCWYHIVFQSLYNIKMQDVSLHLYFGAGFYFNTLALMMSSYMPLNNTINIPSSIIQISDLMYFSEMSVHFLEFQMKFCLVKPLNAAYIFNDDGAIVCGFGRPERLHHFYLVNFPSFYACLGLLR